MLFVLYSSQTLTRESAHLIGVSTYGGLKMHCLYVAGSIIRVSTKGMGTAPMGSLKSNVCMWRGPL